MAALTEDAIQEMTIAELEEALHGIFSTSSVAIERRTEILFAAIAGMTPVAEKKVRESAGGSFWQFLMQLLVQFLPILLKLLGGI